MSLAQFVEDYDWGQAFEVSMPPRATEGYVGSLDPFGPTDVTEIIAADEGQNDGDSWVGAFRLADGRFVKISAWCDYTGWDCRSGGDAEVADSIDNLVRWALTNEERMRLGLATPDESQSASAQESAAGRPSSAGCSGS